VFCGSKKAFDRVPGEVIRGTVCKLGVEQLVSAVMSMHRATSVSSNVYAQSN